MTNDTRNHHALSVTDAGGSVLGRELCCRARAGAGRGSDPDDRSALGADGAAAGPALPTANRRQSPPAAGKRPAVVVLTLCGQVSFPLTLYIGLQTTSALNAAIYMSATPSMVLLINRLIFRDPVLGRNWLGVAFSTLGVMILLFQGNPLHAASLHTFAIGDLWAMGSALSWALYCSLLRLKDRRIPANGFVAVSSLLGALILVPIVIFWLMRHPAQDWAAWREPFFLSGLAYLVIFPSWLAYLFWNKGIATIGATRGEIYTHIIPLSGGVLSILFLHTQPQAWHLFSALFIMVGIGICSLEKRQAASIRLRD